MKNVFLACFLAIASAAGCGGDDEEGTSGSSGDTGGDATSTGGDATSTGGSSCTIAFDCVNGACACSAGPNEGNSCCDPEDEGCGGISCDDHCQVCS